MSTQNPFQEYFLDILREAYSHGASDIHIEPYGAEIIVRIRVDGIMRIIRRESELSYMARLSEVIKKTSQFDMGVSGLPQDQRFRIPSIPEIDFRASLCPTMNGEKIVLRLLERNKDFSLETYNLHEEARQHLYNALARWQGLILVSGPTGSGKSTLLYSALGAIDRVQNSVHTIEDPIEYTLPYLNQTQVRPGSLSFAQVLRSLLRQDPDVILIGEIRDEETAEAAMHAASTGHLVLSTVHANSAEEITGKLAGLGVSKDALVSSLLFASAQRLLPNLCRNCVQDDPMESEHYSRLFGKDAHIKYAPGCEMCVDGYKGRTLLFEWITGERKAGTYELRAHGSLSEEAQKLLLEGQIDAKTARGIM
ncbi:MAG TPA: ATPase, T2SS/T4P/T4SS family [Oligoflexus sp.]|uniref:GspE/PulE family protein n=1 Tax=Oligoflexus sp. TaxID=1971216 RepID=UPI002D6092F1|nr:ATPase, T2SS/T4P/T4SS family [Oligoflexus sp.]HYX31589.1 ATPase, T2SS/T4P/T4SS family [Oligoflexus sp.]